MTVQTDYVLSHPSLPNKLVISYFGVDVPPNRSCDLNILTNREHKPEWNHDFGKRLQVKFEKGYSLDYFYEQFSFKRLFRCGLGKWLPPAT